MERDLSRNLTKEKGDEAGWREPEGWLSLPASSKSRAVPLRRDKLGPKGDPSTVNALNRPKHSQCPQPNGVQSHCPLAK